MLNTGMAKWFNGDLASSDEESTNIDHIRKYLFPPSTLRSLSLPTFFNSLPP